MTLLIAAVFAFQAATSVTGAWTGTLGEDPIHIVLRQGDGVVTGTAGPDVDHQYPIKNGKITATKESTQLSFEVIANGVHMTFKLKLMEGLLKGEARVEGEDGQAQIVVVELKPVR